MHNRFPTNAVANYISIALKECMNEEIASDTRKIGGGHTNTQGYSTLARRCNLDARQLFRIHTGEYKECNLKTADKLAIGLGYTISNIWPKEYLE